jgi:hypothetical protein
MPHCEACKEYRVRLYRCAACGKRLCGRCSRPSRYIGERRICFNSQPCSAAARRKGSELCA